MQSSLAKESERQQRRFARKDIRVPSVSRSESLRLVWNQSEALAHRSVLKSALCPFLLFFSVHRDVLLLLLPLGSSHGGNGFLAARGLASGLPRELWTAESSRDSAKGI